LRKYPNEVLENIKQYAEVYMIKYETNNPSATYIAKELNLDRHTVSRILKEMGYEIIKANKGKRNGAKSGEDSHMFGKKQSKETQEKKRLKLKGKKRPKEIFEKIINTRKKNGNLVPSNINVRYYEDLKMTLRSSWEADYIRYLNFKGIKWEYEKHTFNLQNEKGEFIGSYTPDFYLPNEEIFVEVKGFYSDKNKKKMQQVQEQYPYLKIKLITRTDYDDLSNEYEDKIPFWGDKGESTRESMNVSAKLSVEQVKEIKHLLIKGELKNIEIAKQYSVSAGTISAIKNMRIWSYVIVEEDGQ
jgi:hypothetical protein